MHTQCTHCGTVFRITRAELGTADGRVRCCLCRTVFDARTHLAEPPAQEASKESNSPESANATPDTTSPPAPAIEKPSPKELQPYSDLAAELEQLVATQRPAWQNAASIAVIVVLGIALPLQYCYFNRDRLSQNQTARPIVSALCRIAGCRLPLMRDAKKIALLDRQVRTHPDFTQAILVQATIENRAEFKQPYPIIQFSMSDIRGQIVASRRFSPAEYLPPDVPTAPPALGAKSVATITLEMLDPGQEAVSFEFDFL